MAVRFERKNVYCEGICRGEPLLQEEPKTLADLFRMAERHNLPDALNYKRDGRWQRISSGEMLLRARNIAFGLRRLGLEKGDKAAILSSNSPEWTLSDAGCQFAGITDVPIYTTLSPESVEYIIRDSGSRVIFIENEELYRRIAGILPQCAAIEKIIFFQPPSEMPPGSISLAELEAGGSDTAKENSDDIDKLDIRQTDIATLIYTSGTTGEPKGVMLTHCNIISNVIDAGEKYDFAKGDCPLSVLPLSHIFERSAMYLYIFNGMRVFYAESVERVPENLAEVRPTIFVGVPRIFEKVYARAKLQAALTGGIREKIFDFAIDVAKSYALAIEKRQKPSIGVGIAHAVCDRLIYKKLREFFGGRLRFCITGGAALSDEIYLIFNGAGIPIMQGYGLTETSPVISSNNPYACKLGTVGRPIRNVSVRIAEDGEIEALGPGVMLGYYNKPEATKEAFTDDGWFRTGDIGRIDEDGFLIITDRKKELFKTSGGKYIAPSPIEQKIVASRFVSQAALIGNGRKFAAALIVPNFDMLDSYAIHKGFKPMKPAEYCRDERIRSLFRRQIDEINKGLSRFETIKAFELLDKEFSVEGGELTPTLKLKRRVIDEKYKDVIDRMYSEAEREFAARAK